MVKEKIKFNEIKDAQLGEEVYVVVKTENMPGREIKMNLKQGGATKVLTEKEDAIRVIQKGRNAYMFTPTVGAFTKKNTFSNAKDFENYGIAKITLGSTNKDTNTQYKEALEKVEGQRTQLYLAMDAEPANQNLFSVKYEEVFDNRPNLWYYGKGNWFELKYNIVNEYEIHHNEKIYKTIVKNAKKGKYIYIDKQNKKHDLGTYDFKSVKNNYGANYGEKTVNLVDFRKIKNYSKGGVKFSISINTSRYYMNELTLASLFGAMLKCGYEDFTFNGFSDSLGRSVGGSKTHKNGFNGDLRYLRKDKTGGRLRLDYNKKSDKSDVEGWKELDEDRQNKFNDSLYIYGWKSLVSQKYGEKKDRLLNHCKEDKKYKKHYDHLHVQGYDKNFIKKKK